MLKKFFACTAAIAMLSFGAFAQKLTVNVDKPTIDMSPYLYGAFFEDISHTGDGGLVPNMIENHSFEYYPFRTYDTGGQKPLDYTPLTKWEEYCENGGNGRMFVTGSYKLAPNNLRNLTVLRDNAQGYYGVANSGYDLGGITVKKGESYNFSFYSMILRKDKGSDFAIKAVVLDSEGKVVASKEWNDSELSKDWKKYSFSFTPDKTAKNAKAAILYHGKIWAWLDMVDLSPADTYHGHGLRKDFCEAIEGLHPTFLRFPGGCIVHGTEMSNMYDWKSTVGPVENRKTNWSRWGYFQSCTLGYYEYFILCEDMGMLPLPVLPVGVTCGFEHLEATPMNELNKDIQDALDVVEFANGGVDTKWGKVRADMGHPAPFNLTYLALGNEEHDNALVRERFPLFVKAFKEKYPEIKLVGTSGLGESIPLYDMMCETKVWSSDEHYYPQVEWFADNQHRFDNWDRSLPKVYIGEYAAREKGVRGSNLYHALCEAAFLTGCERNSDIVEMTSYAPIGARTEGISPVPITFNTDTTIYQATYYVQSMFGGNKGTKYLSNTTSTWPENDRLAVSTTYDEPSGDVIIKLVNLLEKPTSVQVSLKGVKSVSSKGTRTIMSGKRNDGNTIAEPDKVKAVTSDFKTARSFSVAVPGYSVQVIRTHVTK